MSWYSFNFNHQIREAYRVTLDIVLRKIFRMAAIQLVQIDGKVRTTFQAYAYASKVEEMDI